MKYKCMNCGKTVYNAPEERSYCDECRDNMLRLIFKQDAACRRELGQLKKRIKEVSDNHIRTENHGPDQVLVFEGMEEIARLLGENIKVAETGKAQKTWLLYFDHDGVNFHTFGTEHDPEVLAIIRKWEEKHGTFC